MSLCLGAPQKIPLCFDNFDEAEKGLSTSNREKSNVRRRMPSALIRQVADYCWSNNFLDVFHKFFRDHAEAFIGAPDMTGGEHNMEYYALFQLYLEVYEATLTEYLSTLETSIEEFYAEVREVQDESMDPYLKTFVDCLLASADYESFYKVMVREGKKKATAIKKEQLKAEVKMAAAGEAPEGKGVSAAVSTRGYDADDKGAYRSDDVADSKSSHSIDVEFDAKGSAGSGADYK